MEQNMEELFGLSDEAKPIAEAIKEDLEEKLPPVVIDQNPNDVGIEEDYKFAKQNLKRIIDNGQMAMEELASIASVSESPRAFEVLSTLMKTMTEANKDLLNLRKQVKDLKGEEGTKNVTNNNALFVGSTAELQKFLKNSNT